MIRSSMKPHTDIRDIMFEQLAGTVVTAEIRADGTGMLCGVGRAVTRAAQLDLAVHHALGEGASLGPGTVILRFSGAPKQVLMGEEVLMGCMAKTSGIATAAGTFVARAGDSLRIVSGAWKKMPLAFKPDLREAVVLGGVGQRITDLPFIYLDKNYTAVFGGIAPTLKALSHLNTYVKVIHIRGTYGDIADEAMAAARYGAGVIFIDTGNAGDVVRVTEVLSRMGWRSRVKIAFGGNVVLEEIDHLKSLDLDILDIGRAIIDAPLLVMRMEIVQVDHDRSLEMSEFWTTEEETWDLAF